MKKVWTLVSLNLKIVYRDKTAVIWMVLVPLFYILVFGSAFNFSSDPSQAKAYLAVVNQDDGFLSQQLMAELHSEHLWIDTLHALPDEPRTRMLTIPDSFTHKVLNGTHVELLLQKKQDAHLEAQATAKLAIQKSYFRLLADLVELHLNDKQIEPAALIALKERQPKVTVTSQYAGKHQIIPSGFNHQVPANIVMFTLIIVFIYAGEILMEEKTRGMLRRVHIAPISTGSLFAGKLLGITLIGLLQIGVLIAAGHFIFGIYYGPSPAALALLALLFAACCGAMGLVLAMLIKGREKLTGIALVTALGMSALSGCWWPVEITPDSMRTIAHVLPSGIALDALHQLISYSSGLTAIASHLIYLLMFTIGFSLIFGWLLKRQDTAKL